jgi:Zn-dependent peptidase ImmA (M78 family)
MRSKVKEEAEKDAERLLKVALREGFAVEPVGVANRLGIQVLETEFDEETLGALFMRRGVDPEIVLNRRHSFLRRRLTCAIELGHYVRLSARTNEYKRVDLYNQSEELGGEADEAYAHEFAACFLMPEDDIRILADLRMDDLEMALRLVVPREAMQVRLGDLGVRVPGLEAA